MNIIFTEQIVEGFTYNSSAGVYVKVITPSPCILELGKEYIVKWGDTEYTCTSFLANINGYEMVAIGNKAITGGDNTGESFAIAYNPTTDYLNLFAMTADASHNIAIYTSAEEIETPDEPEEPIEPEETTGVTITLYDRTGQAVNYNNVETITTDTPDAEQGATFTYGVAVENAEYEPDFADGNQKVTLEKGQLLKEFTLVKPENLVPEYIKKNISVAGVVGEFAGDEMEKTVLLNMADGDQVIEADEDTVLTKVTVTKPETLAPENIAKGVDIGGVVGTMNIGPITNTLEGVYVVTVIDFDGSIIKTQELSSGERFILPDAPEHDRLVFDGWVSAAFDIVDNTITVENFNVTVGAIYHTVSGATEIDIELNAVTGLSVYFQSLALTGMTSIDWGDGTVDKNYSHTYSSYGEYTIKIYGLTEIGHVTSSYGCIITETSGKPKLSIKRIFIAKTVTKLNGYSFRELRGLEVVTIPNSVTNIGAYTFYGIYFGNLTVILPSSVTTLGSDAFAYCYCLENVILSKNITTVANAFYQDRKLCSELIIPKEITVIPAGMANGCSFERVIVLGAITAINNNSFSGNYNCKEYDFSRCTSVPTLASTSIFNALTPRTKIKVPASLYDSWKTASNWSTYANYIVAV